MRNIPSMMEHSGDHLAGKYGVINGEGDCLYLPSKDFVK